MEEMGIVDASTNTGASSQEVNGGDAGQTAELNEQDLESAQGNVASETMIPKARFDPVWAKMKNLESKVKAYAELGDIETLKATIEEHKRWKQAVENARRQQSMTDDERLFEEKKQKILKQLFDIYPELQYLPALMKKIDELHYGITSNTVQAVVEKASAELSDLLRANKIDLSMQDEIEDYLAARMTDEELERFFSGDLSIMREKFKQSLEKGLLAKFRTPTRIPPPTRHTPGGTGAKAANKKPKTLDEVTADAYEIFRSS